MMDEQRSRVAVRKRERVMGMAEEEEKTALDAEPLDVQRGSANDGHTRAVAPSLYPPPGQSANHAVV